MYDPNSTLVEERIVLIRARNDREALRKAKEEARNYARENRFENVYGERVQVRSMGAFDVFELMEASVDAGVELFSSNRVVSKSVSEKQIAATLVGPGRTPDQLKGRGRFLDYQVTLEFMPEVLRSLQGSKRRKRRA